MKSDLLPELVRAYLKILHEADMRHSPPSVVQLIMSKDKDAVIVLSSAAVQLAEKVAQTSFPECVDAFEVALCAHYSTDLTQQHVTTLIDHVVDGEIIDLAEASGIVLLIEPEGRLWGHVLGSIFSRHKSEWRLELGSKRIAARNLEEELRYVVQYKATG